MLRTLFTETCPSCGGYSRGGFCEVCAAELSAVGPACPRCGLARPVAQCPARSVAWQVEALAAPLAYRPPLDHYVQALKYRSARHLGRALALLIAPALASSATRIDAIVAVPLHRARLRERGYNQALEVARTLAGTLGLPLLQQGITRHGAGPSQTSGNARQRRVGVAHAFAVQRDLGGRRIAIVDDVVTTGATVNALAAALLAAGAASCVAWGVARTPEDRSHRAQPRNV